ncbi:MAG: CPBP family intramembrane metalloprotease [Bacteroidaceae bacterium]|nr:CPBP family intramembrane metalloprotease [Bacteroidaceae bacterium]
MRKNLKVLGVVVLLLIVYAAFQGIFTGIAIGVAMGCSIAAGKVSVEQLANIGNVEKITDIPGLEGCGIEVVAVALFLAALSMLLFIHLTKLFRLRVSLFRSIAFKPLIVSTLLVFSSMFALNIFVQFFPLDDLLANEFQGLSHSLLGAFTISVLAPLLEEVMFRGAIQGYMMRTFRSPWLAIVVAALVFGIFHMNPIQIVYASLLGFVFGWIYYRTGSLMSVIVGHVLNNSIATLTMLCFGESTETEIIEEFSPFAENVMSGILFVLFTAVSLFLAVKLNRMLPVPPVPWHDSDEKPQPSCESSEASAAMHENSCGQ